MHPLKILFRCDAGRDTGFGHLVRSLALAKELSSQGHCSCFLLSPSSMGRDRVEAAGFPCCISELKDFEKFVSAFHVFVADLENGCPEELAERVRPLVKTFVVLDGVGFPDERRGRLLADLVFFQGLTNYPETLDWAGFKGQWFKGAEWVILRPEFRLLRKQRISFRSTPRLVLMSGGADPKDLASLFYQSLGFLKGLNPVIRFRIDHIIGPADILGRSFRAGLTFAAIETWELDFEAAENGHSVRFLRDPANLPEVMSNADLAVAVFGMSVYELLCLGIPTISLAISKGHLESLGLLQEKGAVRSLGLVETCSPEELAKALADLAGAEAERSEMSRKALELMDGLGARRVADKIEQYSKEG